MIKNYKLSWILKGSLIIIFLLIDLLSKYFLQKYFENGGETITVISNLFDLQYVKNEGISFGLFKGNKIASLVLPIIFLIVFFVVDFVSKPKSYLFGFGFSLIIAGALGNLYDRIILNFVRDFFAFSFFPFVFNIADACISVGFVLIVLYLLLDIIKENKNKNIEVAKEKNINQIDKEKVDQSNEISESKKENSFKNLDNTEEESVLSKNSTDEKVSIDEKKSADEK